ncbi:hypothetical protein LC087_14985 [Bacillus carboniphilus]|uniref:DUF2178 domain-containing protein n=1 Tax=Bacillus carboniphilus TaxID=86663 RepID=A0ABY9JUF6_9BACI|nr:hypothetical protein [Bacillus carboniphilus]WLR42060.1 hypothetical protein LC087_14985 [Bacillus carboniphilus]
MQNKYVLLFTVGLSFLLLLGIGFEAMNFIQAGDTTFAWLLGGLSLLVLVIVVPIIIQLWRETKQGIPRSDERSKKIKLFAAGYSYFYSLFLWLGLFAFKSYLDFDDLLMFGLGGMVLLFWGHLLIMRKRITE